ncbi:hypothetical protein CEW87_07855 [Parazoarcus communis]|uniref:DUF3592 domain-containing protein n=1 Tax=Parazoarcus communis TaxID=41977 RepID=A0A2U8H272_9RHOO|nr:DUF3592 domain-containing protein [Parazoarcus communis]AWI79286.1 hypothetical protein CEW87_07855 [Parazoarcus communis]
MIEYATDMWALAFEGDKQGVLFFVVVYALIVCLYSFFRQVLIRRWPVAKGRLLSASVEKWGISELVLSDQDYKVDSLYEYHVSEKSYQGKRVSPWIIIASHNARFLLKKQLNGVQKNEDGTVNVFYHPKNPAKSYLVKPGFFGMAINLCIAVLPLLLYAYEYS